MEATQAEKRYFKVTIQDNLIGKVFLRIERAATPATAAGKARRALGYGPNPPGTITNVRPFGAA